MSFLCIQNPLRKQVFERVLLPQQGSQIYACEEEQFNKN